MDSIILPVFNHSSHKEEDGEGGENEVFGGKWEVEEVPADKGEETPRQRRKTCCESVNFHRLLLPPGNKGIRNASHVRIFFPLKRSMEGGRLKDGLLFVGSSQLHK